MAGFDELRNLLLSNVLDVRFLRRTPKAGSSSTRRMLCTNSAELLNSYNGKVILGYQAPTQYPKFNPKSENIIITWDILMQDYRCINVDNCTVIQRLAANDEFWKYFNENIYIMSTSQKINFMNT
jgi:hypothetical protein